MPNHPSLQIITNAPGHNVFSSPGAIHFFNFRLRLFFALEFPMSGYFLRGLARRQFRGDTFVGRVGTEPYINCSMPGFCHIRPSILPYLHQLEQEILREFANFRPRLNSSP